MIIPSGRLTPWTNNVGVSGGIPNRTTVYQTLNPGASAAQIQTAIENCPAGQVVQLASGVFNLSGNQIRIYRTNDWTLRGAGMGKTVITGAGNSIFYIGDTPWMGTWGTAQAISSGAVKGSTQINVASTAGMAVGQLIWIEQENVSPVFGFGAGGGGAAAQLNSDRLNDNTAVVNVRAMVKNIQGTVVTFDPPLPFTFDGSPVAAGYNGLGGASNCGIEDLTVKGSTAGSTQAINFVGCYNFWLKNIELTNFTKRGVVPSWGCRMEMRGCYIHEGAGGHDNGYAVECNALNNSLFEDNIWYKCQASHFLQGGCNANVIAYNVVFHTWNQDSGTGWMAGGFVANHSPYPMYNLYEGNYVNSIQPDFYYGGSRYGTILRNFLPATDVATDQHRQAVSIDSRQWDYSVVGNILGVNTVPNSITLGLPNVTLNFAVPGALSWTYGANSIDNDYAYSSNRILRLGYPAIGGNGYSNSGNPPAADDTQLNRLDMSVKPNASHGTIVHGNWDAANDTVIWDTGIADLDVPDSLFHASKPSWFGGLAWPPYDAEASIPTIEEALARIPAGYRLLNAQDPPDEIPSEGVSPASIRGVRILRGLNYIRFL